MNSLSNGEIASIFWQYKVRWNWLTVVFAIVSAAVVPGERLNWQHYIGGAFIESGVIAGSWA